MGKYAGCNPDVVGAEKDEIIADLVAVLQAIASGLQDNRVLAEWELSSIAEAALRKHGYK